MLETAYVSRAFVLLGLSEHTLFQSLFDSPPVKPFFAFGLTFRLLPLSRARSLVLALRRLWLGLAFLLARLLSFAAALSIPWFRSLA